MKQTILFLAVLLGIGYSTVAKEGDAQKTKNLNKVLTLKIDREGGANGASVAWHPTLKRYYAAQAGNKVFPMIIFNSNAEKISKDTLETMFDVRGFWYNPAIKTFQANGYDDFGWGEYKLDKNGIPIGIKQISANTGQPSEQSVGAYNAKKSIVYFYNHSSKNIEGHKISNASIDETIKLYPGAANEAEAKENEKKENKDEYNENAIIYTGISHSEIGLLNVTSRRIELYDIKTGYMTLTLSLPDDAPVEQSLNFSYCNETYWLFNKTHREWYGYKAK